MSASITMEPASPADVAPAGGGKVLVYRSALLSYSETFILEQVRNLRTWRGVLVGERRVADGLDLSGTEYRIVGGDGWFSRNLQRAIRLSGGVPSRILNAFRNGRPNLIHAHFGTDGTRIWPVAKALGVPLLVTLHGYDINVDADWWRSGAGGWRMKAYPDRLRALGNEPDVWFLAVSQPIREQAIRFGIPRHKITVVHIGVDTRRFRPADRTLGDRTEVLFVGRMIEKKGCRYLVEAFAAVQGKHPWARLVLVGDGPLFGEMRRLANQLGARAEFLGVLTSDQVRERFATARVLCLPSVRAKNGDAEGLPIVILEAQAAGVPVITSAHGGATEGIDSGRSGYSHGERDTGALAAALDALLGETGVADAFGRCARAHAERHFDIRSCTRQLEVLYSKCSTARSDHGGQNGK